jgi:hypothetical protein
VAFEYHPPTACPVAAVQMEEKLPEGLLQLRQVMKRFTAGGERVVATPWQFSPAHALVVA